MKSIKGIKFKKPATYSGCANCKECKEVLIMTKNGNKAVVSKVCGLNNTLLPHDKLHCPKFFSDNGLKIVDTCLNCSHVRTKVEGDVLIKRMCRCKLSGEDVFKTGYKCISPSCPFLHAGKE